MLVYNSQMVLILPWYNPLQRISFINNNDYIHSLHGEIDHFIGGYG